MYDFSGNTWIRRVLADPKQTTQSNEHEKKKDYSKLPTHMKNTQARTTKGTPTTQ